MRGSQYCSNIVKTQQRTVDANPLTSVPNLAEAAHLAATARRGAGQPREGLVDLPALCRKWRVSVQVTELSTANGGLEGLLMPLPNDRFGISVDPIPSGGWSSGIPQPLREDLLRHRVRFRIAHELGHTLFYKRRPNAPPKRRLFDSPQQEMFCDRFARDLLAPAHQAARVPATPDGVLKFQAMCDVSLEVAARAVAEAQSGSSISIWRNNSSQELVLQWASNKQIGVPRRRDGMWLEDRAQLLMAR